MISPEQVYLVHKALPTFAGNADWSAAWNMLLLASVAGIHKIDMDELPELAAHFHESRHFPESRR